VRALLAQPQGRQAHVAGPHGPRAGLPARRRPRRAVPLMQRALLPAVAVRGSCTAEGGQRRSAVRAQQVLPGGRAQGGLARLPRGRWLASSARREAAGSASALRTHRAVSGPARHSLDVQALGRQEQVPGCSASSSAQQTGAASPWLPPLMQWNSLLELCRQAQAIAAASTCSPRPPTPLSETPSAPVRPGRHALETSWCDARRWN